MEVNELKPKQVYHNLSYQELFKHETGKGFSKLERGVVTRQPAGAVAVDTGKFTGRAPKDKYIVGGGPSAENIWWAGEGSPGSDNKPISIETWDYLLGVVKDQLTGKRLYLMDGWAGASKENRFGVRMVTEVAWQAHFFKNMFIKLSKSENLKHNFVPEWTIWNGCKTVAGEFETHGLNSPVFIAINIEKKTILIGGTWYGGEIKKGIFSVANYLLPLKGVGSFHCSANEGAKGDVALFFGLSGTGKTTLSHDPRRKLIGDDEHGWDDEGVFNLEGGCYAKVINLSQQGEPDIYKAIKRNALLENVVIDGKGRVDFSDVTKTQNTRVSYPIDHVKNIVRPVSKGGHAQKIIFLTCDSFGVLPPVARLTRQQAEYWFLSGYTAKVAGTERGVDEPQATFSACFGAPFLLLHPTAYAEILGKKIDQHQAQVYLVSTGWTGGGYGVGQRMPLANTRAIITAILTGKLEKAEYEPVGVFALALPKKVAGVSATVLNPRNTWADKREYDLAETRLARMFIDNFKTFSDTKEGLELEKAGPRTTGQTP